MPPTVLRRTPRRLVVTPGSVAARHAALAVTGAYERGAGGAISYPLEPFVVADLRLALGEDLCLDPSATAWWEAQGKAYKLALATAALENVSIPGVPWGDRLYPYQRVGVAWLATVRRGILGDEMGLGKTLEALSAAADARRVLVVTVPMAIHAVWQEHVVTWMGRPAFAADGTKGHRQRVVEFALKTMEETPAVLIINHEMLRARAAFPELWRVRWDAVIVDEAHKLQGRPAYVRSDGTAAGSQQSRGAFELTADRLFLATGTPFWNRPESVWALLHLIDPARFTSFWDFVGEYCRVEETPWARKLVGAKPEAAERLRNLLAPFILQRLKADVLPQLPAKVVQTLEYPLDEKQRAAYRTLRKEYRVVDTTGHTVIREPSIPATFADMRRLLNAPSLLGLTDTSDAKAAMLDGLVDEVRDAGKPLVIFVWHVDYGRLLRDRYARLGARLVVGGQTAAARDADVAAFQAGECPILIVGIAAGGVAIDLTAASMAIFAEGCYVPAQIKQAEDRLHRIGQQCDVHIYRLAARNTIESAIWQVVDMRQDETDEMLSFESVVKRVLEQDEGDED